MSQGDNRSTRLMENKEYTKTLWLNQTLTNNVVKDFELQNTKAVLELC